MFYFQVPVTVYYESLCPDSAKFVTEQLYPAVKGDLKDHVDITWVPFGKSSVSSILNTNMYKWNLSLYIFFYCSTPPKVQRLISIVIMVLMNVMAIRYMPVPLNIYKPTHIKLNSHVNHWLWTLSLAWWKLARISPIMFILVPSVLVTITLATGKIFNNVPTVLMAANS